MAAKHHIPLASLLYQETRDETKRWLMFKKKAKSVGQMKQILGSFIIKNVQIEWEDFDDVDFEAFGEAT